MRVQIQSRVRVQRVSGGLGSRVAVALGAAEVTVQVFSGGTVGVVVLALRLCG